MARRDLSSPGLAKLLDQDELLPPDEYEYRWLTGLDEGDPLVHHLRGQPVLKGRELRHAALTTACGVSSAIDSIQGRMAVGVRDQRLAERKRVEGVARLPNVAPVGVDPVAWAQVAELHDVDTDESRRLSLWEGLELHRKNDHRGYQRLARAAWEHDLLVEHLIPRALVTEDSLAFAGAARALWRRFLGSERAFPALPTHAAAFVLSVVYSRLEVGALLASMSLSSCSSGVDFEAEPIRTRLRQEVDASLRFWAKRVSGSRDEGAVLAREFIAVVGDLVAAERRTEGERLERDEARRWDRRRLSESESKVEWEAEPLEVVIASVGRSSEAVQVGAPAKLPDREAPVVHFELPDPPSGVEGEPPLLPTTGED